MSKTKNGVFGNVHPEGDILPEILSINNNGFRYLLASRCKVGIDEILYPEGTHLDTKIKSILPNYKITINVKNIKVRSPSL